MKNIGQPLFMKLKFPIAFGGSPPPGLCSVGEAFHGVWRLRKLVLIWHFLAVLVANAAPGISEYQVKALFLFNFIKYVEWPQDTFEGPDTPITIGVFGKDPFNGDLQRAVNGKDINGRKIIVKTVGNDADPATFNLLFISASENANLDRILEAVKGSPVLTVGEDWQFIKKGGIINFVIKDEKVRLEISLPASHEAHLQISSRLLSVADVVKTNNPR